MSRFDPADYRIKDSCSNVGLNVATWVALLSSNGASLGNSVWSGCIWDASSERRECGWHQPIFVLSTAITVAALVKIAVEVWRCQKSILHPPLEGNYSITHDHCCKTTFSPMIIAGSELRRRDSRALNRITAVCNVLIFAGACYSMVHSIAYLFRRDELADMPKRWIAASLLTFTASSLKLAIDVRRYDQMIKQIARVFDAIDASNNV